MKKIQTDWPNSAVLMFGFLALNPQLKCSRKHGTSSPHEISLRSVQGFAPQHQSLTKQQYLLFKATKNISFLK